MGRIGLIVLVIILGVGFSSVMVVNEGERAIVSRFGEILKDNVEGQPVTRVFAPGLHFKIPAIDKVKYLDARIQTLDGAADRFVTSEKKDLMVDSYVKWRISDFEKFYLSTGGGNVATAESLLQRKINNDLRTEFGRRTIKEIVSGERDELQINALENASESSQDLGIDVVDVRVKQINLPANVSSSIFQRMRAERQAVAKEHRAQGKEQSEIIRATIDANVTVKVAEAERKALTVRGEGDALSAKIYADAYNKDAEFYGFLRSLEAYKASFAGNSDVMVLEPDSDFFKYMKSIDGK
ncbi:MULTISPECIES: protease modulator HflC [unclassified Shewanella]|uniref:protease modulator HflC n=1 Tax=unclassified Shewanella TaxID=196818 RepID=UPI000C84B6BE|nr:MULTISPECIES: protease modulator HflC [unclassified Shewanella]MDO6618061.1 protease modulator HflC [Shewanella sp. 6_MG-2023]MDO6640954.1 protease modulator HflC [Shewanella sp. 5_MG-2023]MDO6679220.1 protease modulator HflC [Shewanella sp. 4_MG-2023]MDO6776521.1 protease modulator HflC [Shewanella sp. 3_MG-2023]PMG30689.1 protease modulator HflC [Shewanella sp. 10N.286.52.C2]